MIDRFMRTFIRITLTLLIFILGYWTWTNPEIIHWIDKIIMLWFCVFIWIFAMKGTIK